MSTSAIPVVMYHGVAPERPGWLWNYLITPVELFERQMELLVNRGWKTITLAQLHAHMKDNAPLPERPVVLTFDDGYLDNWVYVYPILRKYGLHAVIWMTTDFIDRAEKPRPNLDDLYEGRVEGVDLSDPGFLSWPEMRKMEETGHVEIQSHASTHTWYFTGPEIIDFHRPAGIDGYVPEPWLSWNINPEMKPYYMSRDFSGDVPLGSPIYRYGKSLSSRRYFEDPELAGTLAAFVANNGGADFFSRTGWRAELSALAEETGSRNDRIETEKEYELRVAGELAGSRRILSDGLGHDVDFLCWPGGGYNDTTLRIASEAGYRASTTHYEDSSRRNIFGEEPSQINRIGCGSPWAWKDSLVVSRTDPEFFLAILENFAGKKMSIWKMRWYKMKYLARFYLTGKK